MPITVNDIYTLEVYDSDKLERDLSALLEEPGVSEHLSESGEWSILREKTGERFGIELFDLHVEGVDIPHDKKCVEVLKLGARLKKLAA